MGNEKYYLFYKMDEIMGYEFNEFSTLADTTEYLTRLAVNNTENTCVLDSAKVITGFELKVRK